MNGDTEAKFSWVRIFISSFIGIILATMITWNTWLSWQISETDRTQEGVLVTLANNDKRHQRMYEEFKTIQADLKVLPERIDTFDRWYKTNEIQDQQKVEIQIEAVRESIKQLQLFHEPHK